MRNEREARRGKGIVGVKSKFLDTSLGIQGVWIHGVASKHLTFRQTLRS